MRKNVVIISKILEIIRRNSERGRGWGGREGGREGGGVSSNSLIISETPLHKYCFLVYVRLIS